MLVFSTFPLASPLFYPCTRLLYALLCLLLVQSAPSNSVALYHETGLDIYSDLIKRWLFRCLNTELDPVSSNILIFTATVKPKYKVQHKVRLDTNSRRNCFWFSSFGSLQMWVITIFVSHPNLTQPSRSGVFWTSHGHALSKKKAYMCAAIMSSSHECDGFHINPGNAMSGGSFC